MKIVTIVGARPQFIKSAALSQAFKASGKINEVLVHTGQHYDENMSHVFFEQMKIKRPDYELTLSEVTHAAMTAQIMTLLEPIFVKEHPDFVLVFGDTNSTVAAAMTAVKLGIRLIHVEAGLRSYNMQMPEEVNRIITDRISNILLCPTEKALNNLLKEGYTDFDCKIENVGDVMLDAALHFAPHAMKPNCTVDSDFLLLTMHRQENTSDLKTLHKFAEMIHRLAGYKTVVFPIHPRTRKALSGINFVVPDNVVLLEPVGYLEMIWLLQHCALVVTDSGGLQKEAFFFKKYCITLREQTEWTELIESGVNKLVGIDCDALFEAIGFFEHADNYAKFSIPFYGSQAGQKITNLIVEQSKYEKQR